MTTGTEIVPHADLDVAIAAAERDAVIVWRAEPIGFAELPERIARTSAREVRERLLASYVEALEALNPRYEERAARWAAEGDADLGFDPAELVVELQPFALLSETPYYAALRRYLALVDIEQGDATVADLWHVLRGGAWSHWFGERELERAVRAARRPVSAREDLDGWRAGAAMLAGGSVAGTGALPADAVGEAYASVAGSPEWLAGELGVADGEVAAVADFIAFARLAHLRRSLGELTYELRLRGSRDPALARAYYAGIVGHMIGVEVPEAAYLHAIGRPFASARELRAKILAGDLVEVLEQRHGLSWWRDPAAAELTSAVGAATSLDDALAQLGYDGLDWRPLLRQIRTRLIGEMSGYGGPNITTRAGTRKV
jgi:hypothetical protein